MNDEKNKFTIWFRIRKKKDCADFAFSWIIEFKPKCLKRFINFTGGCRHFFLELRRCRSLLWNSVSADGKTCVPKVSESGPIGKVVTFDMPFKTAFGAFSPALPSLPSQSFCLWITQTDARERTEAGVPELRTRKENGNPRRNSDTGRIPGLERPRLLNAA